MEILLSYVILGLLISLTFPISWLTHISMTNDDTSKTGWASYTTFKKWFNKYEWQENVLYSDSLWNRELDCKIHASIIKFEGIGMKINNPLSYILVKLYVRKYIKSMGKNRRYDFKNNFIKSNEKTGHLVTLPDGEQIFVSMEEIYGVKSQEQNK